MGLGTIFQALILGIIEGFTEFLPVSSTGHILLAGHFLGFNSTGKVFEICIQLGAILAILIVYFQKLWAIFIALPSSVEARRFVLGILIAFLPAAIIGVLAHDFIKTVLFESPMLICTMLILGGIILLWADKLASRPVHTDVMNYPLSLYFKIGLFQCLAMIPGTSRSGSTIVGALLMGTDKRSAAEFSFFLAMPTMVGAFANDYSAFFREVCERTARLMGMWQAVGFSHGVMNTDNMSILGLTIDYGPFGFMDAYEPMFICNHTDHSGRYAFARQPSVGLWNCQALAAAFAGLVDSADLESGLKAYEPAYQNAALPMMRAKFGLTDQAHDKFIPEAFQLMAKAKVDFTQSFRRLSNLDQDDAAFLIADFGNESVTFEDWLNRWQQTKPDFAAMRKTNPNYVLRNWIAETAIRAVEDQGDLTLIDRIFKCVTNPFNENPASDNPEDIRFAGPPPESLRSLEVSCSS